MAISSLGVGSSILTQEVLDQLRSADESARITPVDLSIANEKDKKAAFSILEANMTNLIDSITEVSSQLLFDERSAEVTGTAVEVTADANTDIQDFTLVVGNLATKQIEQSGAFSADTNLIATAAGTMNINVNGLDYTIDYDATTTLDDLKDAINDTAGASIDATVVQIATGEYRLFLSSAETGASQNITVTDDSGFLSDDGGTTAAGTLLTTGTTAIQTGIDAAFTFNGQAITRESNTVDDLITGLNITLKEAGTAVVSVAQNRDTIMEKIDNFVKHYNAAVTELGKQTKSSTDAETRGIFSADSTVKSMQRAIENMVSSVGGGIGSMFDYGFDIDKDGKMSVDKDALNTLMDTDSSNVEAFFAGGDYTDPITNAVTTLTGAFVDMKTLVESYTNFNGGLDILKETITTNISSLEEKKISATEQLDAKYDIMKKQYAAYDLMISRFNSASSMFTQMADAQANA